MALPWILLWRHSMFVIILFLSFGVGRSEEFTANPPLAPDAANVVSDLRDSIAQSLGWSPEEVTVSNIDSLETMFGQATLYEFDVEVGNAIIPLRLSEQVKSWESLEPSSEETVDSENSVAREVQHLTPTLAPFQLAGPLELWIQDADHMRLSVPHDVEAGVLNKVMLADGAVVTVKGARELSLRQPIQLPLPLGSSNTEDGNIASDLIELATKLRRSSSNQENPLSLRIVGPTSLAASPVSEPDSTIYRLKVKRLAPGSVELRYRQGQETSAPISFEDSTSLGPSDIWMWPLPSVNGSDPKLRGIEELLKSILGPIAQNKGSIKLLKAKAVAATFVKIQFELEKKVGADMFSLDTWPEWRTKPSVIRLQFELTGKVEAGKILPLNVQQMEPVDVVESSLFSSLTGNVTFSKTSVLHPPPYPFTL